jgi:hypothetical protein
MRSAPAPLESSVRKTHLVTTLKEIHMPEISQKHRPLYAIAQEIRADWKKVHYTAEPYLAAMEQLDQVTDRYYEDGGKSVVRYFLSNAGGWRGEKARETKAELNRIAP